MATSKTSTNGFLDQIKVDEELELTSETMFLKAFGKLREICFIVKASRKTKRSALNIEVYFKGNNHKQTLRAKLHLRVSGYNFEFDGFLSDNCQKFCSLQVGGSSDNKYYISMSASIFSDSLQLESGMKTAVDKGPALADSFRELFDTGAGSDVTLSTSGEDFKAHKFLLSARSAVFRAMFTTVMQEQQTMRVEITDVEPEVLREVLRYIYTNRVLNIDQMAPRLVYAAEKYALQGLKDLCEDQLCLEISEDNALDLLVTADLVGCTVLKLLATKFVIGKKKEICATEKWKDLSVKHPSLLADMFVICVDEMNIQHPEWGCSL